jgi:parallel beta-helix repeat protein
VRRTGWAVMGVVVIVLGSGLGAYVVERSENGHAAAGPSAVLLDVAATKSLEAVAPASGVRSNGRPGKVSHEARRGVAGRTTGQQLHSTAPAASAGSARSATSATSATSARSAKPTCTSTVRPSGDLAAAVGRLRPGRTLCLAPGTYVLHDRLRLTSAQSGSAAAPAVLAARDGLGSVTIEGNRAEEDLYIAGARHVVVEGLRLTGGAYHGVKIDAPSSYVLIRNTAIFDNVRAADDAQHSGIKGCCEASHITIQDDDIYYTRPAPGVNHQGIDCNSCAGWIVRGNHVHGIRDQQYAQGIQFKSGSTDITIEDNIVDHNFVGIDYGGFGTPAWGHQTYEAVRGVVRNNLLFDNDDAGISVLDVKDVKVLHNTLFGNGFAPDVRRDASNLEYRGNILDRPLLLRDGTSARASDNYVLATPTDGHVFVDLGRHDFTVRKGTPASGHGADTRALPSLR